MLFARDTVRAPAPAGKPILEAIEYVRTVLDEKRRHGPPPMAFVPATRQRLQPMVWLAGQHPQQALTGQFTWERPGARQFLQTRIQL